MRRPGLALTFGGAPTFNDYAPSRFDLRFELGHLRGLARPGRRCRSGPRLPTDRHGARPDGHATDRLGPFAERFAEAGIAALVFDYRGFGDSTGEPDLTDPERELEDWHAAISFARSLPGIDADRVATFGSSRGGGHALVAAARDAGIAAAISQVPFLDRETQAYRPARSVRAQMLEVAEAGGHLPAVGQPHEAAFINAPGAEAGWRRGQGRTQGRAPDV